MDTEMFLLLMQTQEYKDRTRAVMRYVTEASARTMLTETTSRVPSGPTYNSYKKSLKLVQIADQNPVFAVYGDSPEATVVDKSRDILIFRERNTGRRRDKGLEVLLRYQPWTADTLPYQPPSNQVEMRTRRVSEREVELVRKNIEAKRRDWTEDFARARVKVSSGNAVTDQKASSDLAYTALRLEYGLGGSRAVAHWRPALVAVKTQVERMFRRDDLLGRAMADWRYTGWKKWRSLSAELLPATVLDSIEPFQRKISQAG